MTKAKLEANRRNSKRSTGPRTERGKRTAKFNALNLGLFAKHVVIFACDGDEAEAEFHSLLDGLHQEFQPVGTFEEWLVLKIAECMWRLRRATRSENGSVRESIAWAGHRDDNRHAVGLAREIGILTDAEEQLRDSGTLAHKTYEEVGPLVEEEMLKGIQAEKDDKCIEVEIDHDVFLTCITNRKEFLESVYKAATSIEGHRYDDQMAHGSLPPTEDMDKILRYEERMHRQLDWALQRLLETQETRKNSANLSAKFSGNTSK